MKLKNLHWAIFFLILIIGLYLRFWGIESAQSFGWDQGRDSWLVRDIIVKKTWVLNGPRTGVGHFHLGPLWYYLLVPFYYLTNLDPTGANYLNILINILNFLAIFWVTLKIFNKKAALFTIFIYATNKYLIEINRTPWNVSLVSGIAALIFYGIYQIIFKKNYYWIFIVSFLTGLFFHAHFSVIFLPLIIILSFILTKDKKKTLIYSLLSFPLFFIWLTPNIIYDWQTKYNNLNLFSNFFKDYLIDGFHLRFFIYRLYDAFIQFQTILSLPKVNRFVVLIVPVVYFIFLLFEKNKKQKVLGYLISLWFLVPAFGYSFYGGSTSEYYMLMNSVLVIYIVFYIQNRLLRFQFKPLLLLLIVFWLGFTYFQTKDLWVKNDTNGLKKQKEEVRQRIRNNNKINFNEGDIQSYLWQIWVEDKKNKLH
ncbi:hypothetical protein COW98_02595 [Candidatus Roizmanbacteria bacterium CG22_combo_CG10-13_8_21_14_all_35_9]|uniref:Glycosyltransferase RgtA/B/C/D-like domain-containing protein n=2 Tax=Candidatus Roizmaniibacteriota TaxID=1752723 RepID=A0A2H0BYU2_9BACT|nr:MAG: hypothetical protein COW98_02595 [Candidatus Roizmanbacteria bacterium CG22_combo_CG10-13_8_21_14_all_35_9]PIY71487.1 MAG: hypothetical protein COY88_00190 [Candidatus Roizmanbacteria bacterium CG_4_10_14_0_8_um_filter_35_28]